VKVDGTLKLDLDLGLKQVDWDESLSYPCEHMSRSTTDWFQP